MLGSGVTCWGSGVTCWGSGVSCWGCVGMDALSRAGGFLLAGPALKYPGVIGFFLAGPALKYPGVIGFFLDKRVFSFLLLFYWIPGRTGQQSRAEQSRAEQSRAEQSRTAGQDRTGQQSRTGQDRTAEQDSRAGQDSRTGNKKPVAGLTATGFMDQGARIKMVQPQIRLSPFLLDPFQLVQLCTLFYL